MTCDVVSLEIAATLAVAVAFYFVGAAIGRAIAFRRIIARRVASVVRRAP